jgi:acyl-CoA synthetase (AMP-forming)/AMP-acid ligase II
MTSEASSSFQSSLAHRLHTAAEGRALTVLDKRAPIEWLTFGELHDNAAVYASILADQGLGKGDVCVIVLPSDEFACTALLAVLLNGSVPLLVSPPVIRGLHSNLKDVLRHVIGKTEARLVVAADEDRGLEGEMAGDVAGTRFLFGADALSGGDAGSFTPALPDPTDVAALQLTSGTTGFPRICVWRQKQVLAALDGMAVAMAIDSDDVCFNWTPLYHDMGLVNNFFLCLAKGVPLALLGTMDFLRKPARWLQGLSDSGATVTWSPNFGFAVAAQRSRDADLEGVRLDGVKGFWNAAERIHLETMEAFHRRFAPYGVTREALKTNFGCAENVGGATFSDPQGTFVHERLDRRSLHEEGIAVAAASDSASAAEPVKVVSAGRPYPGMTVKIWSPEGDELPDGHVGDLILDTPSRMDGYLEDPEETSAALPEGLLRTGDIAYQRNGEVFWVGRARERINLHGKKYDPSDFESVLLGVEGLREGCFAAFGVDDVSRGTQRLVIVSELRHGSGHRVGAVEEEVRERVALEIGVSVDEILLVPQGTMTKTSSGKRRHKAYRQLYVDGELQALAHGPSQTEG